MLLLIDLDGIFIYIDEVSTNLEKTERRTKDITLPVSIKASKEQLTLFKIVILIKLSPMLKVDSINAIKEDWGDCEDCKDCVGDGD